MKIGYFAPSYKRPEKSKTQIVYPFVKLIVKESEAEEYEKNGNDLIKCPDSAQGNLCRVRNWILDKYLPKFDVVVLMDDDYSFIGRWEGQERFKLNPDEVQEEIEQLAILARDYGAYFFGLNCVADKGAYREHTPFSTNKYIGGPFQAHLKGSTIRYDETLNLKEDYDITLQHLHRYGIALRANFLHYDVLQSKQAGGCASQRNLDEEKRQFYLLQKKWGSKIIQKDEKSKRSFDYNPIMKTPLRGV